MTTTQENTVSTCQCSNSTGKGREVIVITIETCCKRTCEAHQKSLPRPQDTTDDEDGRTSEDEDKKTEEGPTTETDESSPALKKPSEAKVTPKQEQRLFKLPIVVERHHGPGCAMEISVLEKHENSCIYKKEDTEGRNIEDRVGSYECIGRLVFKTCNPNELESDSSGSQAVRSGGSSGPIPTSPTKLGDKSSPALPPPPASSASAPEPSPRNVSPQPSLNKVAEAESPSASSVYGSTKSNISPPPEEVAHRNSIESENGRARSQHSAKIDEETVTTDKKEPVQSGRKRAMRQEHVMMAKTSCFRDLGPIEKVSTLSTVDERRHYPGDDCTLHIPRSPLFLSPGRQFDKIYTSKKAFPGFTDEANQTDPRSGDESGNSKETICSLTDLSKTVLSGKRKSSFFGSLFRRASVKSSSNSDSKRFKR